MIELKNVELWRKTLGAISCFIPEGNFRFNENGISLRAMDPSQIVLVDMHMGVKIFDKFDIEPTFVGMDVEELSKIMNRSMPQDKLLMDLNDSELTVKLDGELHRQFKLPLIDVADDEVELPKAEYDAKIEITARILKEALKDANLFGSSVVFKIKKGQFFIEAKGQQGVMSTAAKKTKAISVKANGEVVSKYSLNYLSNIVKEADSDKKITLEIKTDSPMKVSYKIGDCELQYHLAHMML